MDDVQRSARVEFEIVTVRLKFKVGKDPCPETPKPSNNGIRDIPPSGYSQGVASVEDRLEELKERLFKGAKKRYRDSNFRRDLYDFFVVRLMDLVGVGRVLSTELSLQVLDRVLTVDETPANKK